MRDVSPHGRAGSLLGKPGLEARPATRTKHGVVVAGRHLPRPGLEDFACEFTQRYLLVTGESMILGHGNDEILATDWPMVKPTPKGHSRRQCEIEALVMNEVLDVDAKHLLRAKLQLRLLGGKRVQQRGQRFVDGRQRVGDPQCSGLTASGR